MPNSKLFKFEQPCPIRDILDIIGDKWSILILESLELNKLRFNELLKIINDISKQMLSKTLKLLEREGLISRTAYPEIPPKVEYQLTNLGISFLAPLKQLISWADKNHQLICENRIHFQKK